MTMVCLTRSPNPNPNPNPYPNPYPNPNPNPNLRPGRSRMLTQPYPITLALILARTPARTLISGRGDQERLP
jgi:hypothetical protein